MLTKDVLFVCMYVELKSYLQVHDLNCLMHDKPCLLQVVVCSFVYGGSKIKNKQVAMPESDMNSTPQPSNKSATPIRAPVSQNFSSPAINPWPGSRLVDLRNPHTDIDLTR